MLGTVPGGLPSLGLPTGRHDPRERPGAAADGRLAVRGHPGPERRDLAGLRHEVRATASTRTWTSSGWAWPTSAPGCPARSWSTAARRRPRWWTAPAGGASSRSSTAGRDRRHRAAVPDRPARLHAECGPRVGRVPDRHRASIDIRGMRTSTGCARASSRSPPSPPRPSWSSAWSRGSSWRWRSRSSSTSTTATGRTTRWSCEVGRTRSADRRRSRGRPEFAQVSPSTGSGQACTTRTPPGSPTRSWTSPSKRRPAAPLAWCSRCGDRRRRLLRLGHAAPGPRGAGRAGNHARARGHQPARAVGNWRRYGLTEKIGAANYLRNPSATRSMPTARFRARRPPRPEALPATSTT